MSALLLSNISSHPMPYRPTDIQWRKIKLCVRIISFVKQDYCGESHCMIINAIYASIAIA
jgi:hypothetical protein